MKTNRFLKKQSFANYNQGQNYLGYYLTRDIFIPGVDSPIGSRYISPHPLVNVEITSQCPRIGFQHCNGGGGIAGLLMQRRFFPSCSGTYVLESG